MFIPINIGTDKYKKGDTVVSIKKISNGYGFFTVGHEFTVVEKVKDYSYYTLIDNEHGIVVNKVDPNCLTLRTRLSEAKQICVDITEKRKALYFIKENCPNKDYDYDEYDRYDSCKLKRRSGNECECKLSCVNYVDKKKIEKNGFMKLYMRKLKLKEIIK